MIGITNLIQYLNLNYPYIHKQYSIQNDFCYLTDRWGTRTKITNNTSKTELIKIAEKIASEIPDRYKVK